MNSYYRNRLKLIIILIGVSIIGLGIVIAYFTGVISTFKITALILLIILPVILMTYFFITSLFHFIRKK
ncbi:MAG: hypothetical protein K0R05_2077 [Anaerocolumna sp.]|jgi:hypothetical protein|nr:hypothetical protein [Anaerocolumna sp.]